MGFLDPLPLLNPQVDTTKAVAAQNKAAATFSKNRGTLAGGMNDPNRFDNRDPKDVKNLQDFLINRGYEVKSDGKYGPETEAAAKWFREHHAKGDSGAAAFNVSNARAGAPNGSGTVAPSPTTPVGRSTASAAPAASGSAGGSDTSGIAAFIKSMMGGKDNSASVGRAMTDTQYGAPIAEASRLVDTTGKENASHLGDIKSWFESLIAQNKEGNAADTAALNKVLGDSSGLMKNVLGSLTDESARAQVGIAGLNHETNLKGIGLAEGNFNRNMDSAYALTGRDAATSTAKADTSRLDDMKSKLMDLITARSSALVKNTEDAKDSALGRKGEAVKQFATMAMLQPNLDSAGLDNLYKSAKIDSLMNPPVKPPKAVSASDLAAASADAIKGITGEDANGNPVQKQYPSANDLVRDVNLGFVARGLTSKDPRALAARDAVLRKAGLLNIDPRWTFGLPK